MFLAVASFVGMQGAVKAAREDGLATSAVMFFRTAPGLPLLWLALARRGVSLWAASPRSLFVRSLFGSVAMGTNFTSMAVLSLAQFSTLGLSQPLFVALLSPLILRERVGPHVWLAMAFGAAGAYTLLSPGLETAVPLSGALLGLGSAFASALAHLWVKKATDTDPPERVVFYFAAWVSLAALAYGLPRGDFTLLFSALPAPRLALEIACMAGLGTLGQLFMTRAHVHGAASVVAMVGYGSVPLSMALDAVLWRAAPAPTAYVAAALMLCSGALLVWGEQRRAAHLRALATPPPAEAERP
jgi:drug/metabolite transporter (DMT)-like permease